MIILIIRSRFVSPFVMFAVHMKYVALCGRRQFRGTNDCIVNGT